MKSAAPLASPRAPRTIRRNLPRAASAWPRAAPAARDSRRGEAGGDWGRREARFHATLRAPLGGAEVVLAPLAAVYGLHLLVMGVSRAVLSGSQVQWFADSPWRFVVTYLLVSLVAAAAVAAVADLRHRRPTPLDPALAGGVLDWLFGPKLQPVRIAA
jgi:hypothetical protein